MKIYIKCIHLSTFLGSSKNCLRITNNSKRCLDYGKSREGRDKLVFYMGKCYSIKYTWFRSLMTGIKKNAPIKVHDNVHKVNFKKKKRKDVGLNKKFKAWIVS